MLLSVFFCFYCGELVATFLWIYLSAIPVANSAHWICVYFLTGHIHDRCDTCVYVCCLIPGELSATSSSSSWIDPLGSISPIDANFTVRLNFWCRHYGRTLWPSRLRFHHYGWYLLLLRLVLVILLEDLFYQLLFDKYSHCRIIATFHFHAIVCCMSPLPYNHYRTPIE